MTKLCHNPLETLPLELETYVLKYIDNNFVIYEDYVKTYYKSIYSKSLVFFNRFKLNEYLSSKFSVIFPYGSCYNFGSSFQFGLDKDGSIIKGSGLDKHKYLLSFIVRGRNFKVRELPNTLLDTYNTKQKVVYKRMLSILEIF